MKLSEFSALNKSRCESEDGFAQKIKDWSSADWITAIVGELGEAANIVKKLKRSETSHLSIFNSIDRVEYEKELGKEIADVLCYLDLLAHSCDIDLSTVVKEKFNTVSDRVGSKIKIIEGEEGWIHINDALPPQGDLIIFTYEAWGSVGYPEAGYWEGKWTDDLSSLVMEYDSSSEDDNWSPCNFWQAMPTPPLPRGEK